MPTVTEKEARCRVFTFKEGLLSAVAHDLELEVQRLSITWNDERTTVHATFDARSLRVLHAMQDGRPAPSALSDRDKRKIESTIADDVLHAARYAEIVVVGRIEPVSDARVRVVADVSLAGRSRSMTFDARRDGETWRCRATIHQPDFGITPYSAMLGALKIKPDVTVELTIPER
jgi:polyisoprenoid-binding protein YceI